MSDVVVKEEITPVQGAKRSDSGLQGPYQESRLPLWISLIVIATVSFITRVININYSDGGTPVFDEKHYAPQAYQMLMNSGLEDNPGYGLVVHPPLGKTMISLGEAIFGYTPMGWRFSAIIASVIIVTTLAAMIWRITHSLSAVILTGVLANTEGILHVTGRIGMLDIFLSLFVVLGAFCIVMDISKDRTGISWFHRFWLLGSGIFFGLAMSVKISGVLYPAIAGIILVVMVAISSRSIRTTLTATCAGLIYYLVIPVVIFALSFIPWASAENSVSRHAGSNMFSSFFQYQTGIGEFHTSLLTSEGHTHPWESKPWDWLIGMRPMLYYTNSVDNPVIGSGDGTAKIWLATNPVIWLLLIPVALWLGYRFIRSQEVLHGVAFVGIIMGIVPWLVFYDRTMYLFYTTVLAPFLVIGIVLVLRDILNLIVSRVASPQKTSRWVYGGYSVLAVIAFLLASPWFYGVSVSDDIHDRVEFVDPISSDD